MLPERRIIHSIEEIPKQFEPYPGPWHDDVGDYFIARLEANGAVIDFYAPDRPTADRIYNQLLARYGL